MGVGKKGGIMFIAEAPGKEEDLRGVPLIGRAGKKFNQLLKQLNIKRESVYTTNCVHCRPIDQHYNNRPPTKKEIFACYQFLEKEIIEAHPKIIVALGRIALYRLLNLDRISENRGKIFIYKGIKVIPTFHPAAILRNTSLEKFMLADIQRAVFMLRGIAND